MAIQGASAMRSELIQTISNFCMFIGAVVTALGGLGSYYFGKRVSDAERAKSEQSQNELKQNIDNLLNGNEVLKERLVPFEELAAEIHPTLKLDAALTQLREDFKRLEAIASKYEFSPLDSEHKQRIIESLRPISEVFSARGYEIQVTHETWTNAATQKYAVQLASLLRDAGFQVEGPEQITYYLVQKSSPLEFGISPGMEGDVDMLFRGLLPLFGGTKGWTRREFGKTSKRLRIHFGGSATFHRNGVVVIE